MPVLPGYQAFSGRHWETGTVHNALAYQGIKAPHTGQAPSEALLLGVSGGIAFGYFTFEYTGYLPHLVLLTRNTFNPLDTLLERLAIPQEIYRTDNPEKGRANLLEVLEGGRPALVWADMFTLPYNALPYDERNWAMMPLLVFGCENGTAYLADRASSPHEVPADVLDNARGRVKKDQYGVVALGEPNWSRLPAAVSQGIWQCISLFTEAPPKGKRDNFGLAALEHWANMLTNTRNKQSWARYFEPGERMWMALVGNITHQGAYGAVQHAPGGSAERGMYADFLGDAAAILSKSALKDAASQFRRSAEAWTALAGLLLPDDVPLLDEARTLLDRKHALFTEQGANALPAIEEINTRLQALQKEAAVHFPLDTAQAADFREKLAAQVLHIRDLEAEAIKTLQQAMA